MTFRGNIVSLLFCFLLLTTLAHGEEPAPPTPTPTPTPGPPAKAAVSNDRLDLGGGVTLELTPISSGSFQMGATEKLPESPWIGLGILLGAGVVIVALIVKVAARAIIDQARPRFSLAVLIVGVLAFGVGMVGLVRWRRSITERSELTALPNERPAHAVTITKPFLMGKFCVTQQQFEQVLRLNYSYFKAPNNPVEQVSWDEAVAFCARASAATGRTVRLPTEAEWEYACRAGTHALYSFGDDPKDLFKYAWFAENSKSSTHTDDDSAKNLKANAWGLFDMHGNVMQWCKDGYDESYYSVSPVPDPTGPLSSAFRVVRGSAWLDSATRCRVATRYGFRPDKRSYCVGFRVVVEP